MFIEDILEQRNLLVDAMGNLDFIKRIYPTDANFVLVQVDDADRRYQEFLNNHVVVRNRSKQPLCENALRFTVGTPEENQKLIHILKQMS